MVGEKCPCSDGMGVKKTIIKLKNKGIPWRKWSKVMCHSVTILGTGYFDRILGWLEGDNLVVSE